MLVHSLIFTMLTQFGAIEGQVRDARTHMPITLAKVELWTLQTPVNLQHTNSDGRFQFVNLADGDYSISVSYSGYQPAYVDISMPLAGLPIVIDIVRRETSPTNIQPSISLREYLVPKNARKEFDRARKEVTRQDCRSAVTHFENGLQVFDQDASAHNDLGNCYRQLGELDRAEASFLRARELTDSIYVSLNLAEVYTAQKRLDDREAALVRADSYPHQIADIHVVLAEIYWQKQKSSDAFSQLERYLQEAPNGTLSQRVRQVLKGRPKP